MLNAQAVAVMAAEVGPLWGWALHALATVAPVAVRLQPAASASR